MKNKKLLVLRFYFSVLQELSPIYILISYEVTED